MAGRGPVRGRFKASCTCGWCWYGATQEAVVGAVRRHSCEAEYIDVKNAAGHSLVQTQIAGPSWKKLEPPTVGPKGPAGNSGASGGWKAPPAVAYAIGEPKALVETVPEAIDRIVYGRQPEPRRDVSRETPDPYVEVWRSLFFGWHGRLANVPTDRGTQWWRPLKRFAEYRGSYVHLRYLEHTERERIS